MPHYIRKGCWRETATVEICLVSRDNFFLFTPMLHEIAASDLEITRENKNGKLGNILLQRAVRIRGRLTLTKGIRIANS